jgi:hypothetical protein
MDKNELTTTKWSLQKLAVPIFEAHLNVGEDKHE